MFGSTLNIVHIILIRSTTLDTAEIGRMLARSGHMFIRVTIACVEYLYSFFCYLVSGSGGIVGCIWTSPFGARHVSTAPTSSKNSHSSARVSSEGGSVISGHCHTSPKTPGSNSMNLGSQRSKRSSSVRPTCRFLRFPLAEGAC